MSELIKVTKYRCPYCKDDYDNYDDAEFCRDHNHTLEDDIEIITTSGYQCTMCKEMFKKELDADRCEIVHKKKDDKYYHMFKLAELSKAARHPSQKRLV